MNTILLIDDDTSFREVMTFHLEEAGFRTVTAENGRSGLELFRKTDPMVVLTDVRMPEMNGMDLLSRIHASDTTVPVIVITAFGDIDTAVTAMKKGAFDFIPKPCDRDHLVHVVKKAEEHVSLENEVAGLRRELQGFGKSFIYHSGKMKQVDQLIDKVADSDATVLITGESGTGKELVARELHKRSSRNRKNFSVVNCASIPSELLESELFGHRKGSFSGAVEDKDGKFRVAEGGSVFLDEIGEFPLALQPRLLRTLQEHSVDPVGADYPIPVDVRIIAATNRDLETMVSNGSFRKDLFFRLNVIAIRVPSLRERPEDILPLANHFIALHGKGRPFTMSRSLQDALTAAPWKGNVRELENACQRMVLLSESDTLTPDLLPVPPTGITTRTEQSTELSLPDDSFSLFDFEKQVIRKALEKHHFNKTRTAEYLNIPRHVLLYRIEKYNISKS